MTFSETVEATIRVLKVVNQYLPDGDTTIARQFADVFSRYGYNTLSIFITDLANMSDAFPLSETIDQLEWFHRHPLLERFIGRRIM